jgi:hypothetical protein
MPILDSKEITKYLNSDDYYYPNAIKTVVKYFNNNNIDFLFGTTQKYKLMHGYKPWKIRFTWGFYSSHSTGFFIKRKAAKIIGPYNLRYKLSSDYDYFYRMIVKHNLKGVATKKNEIFGIFRRGGFSSSVNFFDHLIECTRIRLDNKQNKELNSDNKKKKKNDKNIFITNKIDKKKEEIVRINGCEWKI